MCGYALGDPVLFQFVRDFSHRTTSKEAPIAHTLLLKCQWKGKYRILREPPFTGSLVGKHNNYLGRGLTPCFLVFRFFWGKWESSGFTIASGRLLKSRRNYQSSSPGVTLKADLLERIWTIIFVVKISSNWVTETTTNPSILVLNKSLWRVRPFSKSSTMILARVSFSTCSCWKDERRVERFVFLSR